LLVISCRSAAATPAQEEATAGDSLNFPGMRGIHRHDISNFPRGALTRVKCWPPYLTTAGDKRRNPSIEVGLSRMRGIDQFGEKYDLPIVRVQTIAQRTMLACATGLLPLGF
jgi:hypothetical protein